MAKVGEFELLVLLAILRQQDEPYANRVRGDLEANADRTVTRGALYRTLDRLEHKGYVSSSLEAGGLERRGHRRRLFGVTETGLAQLRASRETLMGIWQDVAEALR